MIRGIDERACIGFGGGALICPGDGIFMDEQEKAHVKYTKDCWTCFQPPRVPTARTYSPCESLHARF